MNRRLTNTSAFQRERVFEVIQGGQTGETVAFGRLEVPSNCSHWLISLSDRFDEITSLPRGWDGYQGRPVSFSCATFAANLLETVCVDMVPAPSIVPGSDGTLQIEWHLGGFDLEIDVLGANNVVATRFRHADEEEETLKLANDFSQLADWIDDLVPPPEVAQAANA